MKKIEQVFKKTTLLLSVTWLMTQTAMAQSSGGQAINTALNSASSDISSTASSISKLVLVIGAIVGLVGGVRVYLKWQHGERDIQKDIMGWAGACLFLLLVGSVISAFFGVTTT